jgi:beta-N-acetylhexosaminidase
LSESVINGFLRNEMGYQGIVVSDELNMRALSSQGSISDVAEKAVNAGCDILLFVGYKNDTKAAYDRLVMAYKSGRLPMNRLDQSVRRILALKRTHINFGSPYVDVKNINRYVNTQPQRILSETLRSR